MRSKWLDWKPGVEIIEKGPDPEPTKPSKPGFVGFEGSLPGTFSITRESSGRTQTRSVSRATIPAGGILLAPRYDGGGKPLASVPNCWCCKTPYQLDRLQESKGKTHAWLKPGCGCLDKPQALACCGLCVEHCRCRKRDGNAQTELNPSSKSQEHDFGTPTNDGDSR